MKNEELLIKNTKLVNDTLKMKPAERTPLYANVYYWKILDAGYKMSEGLLNHELMYKIEHDFQEKYRFDVLMGAGSLQRIFKAMNAGNFIIDDEHSALSLKDHHYMEENEYHEINDNISKFSWEVMFKRFCNNGNITMQQMKEGIKEFFAYGEYAGSITEMYNNEFNIPIESPNFFNTPAELFENGIRGLKGAGLDFRRHKSEVKEYFDRKFEEGFPGYIYMLDNPFPYQMSEGYTCMLAQNIMNNKQFDEFFWPYLKRMVDETAERGGVLWSYTEGSIMRFTDYFNDLPKGSFATMLEQDDIFEFRKACPNTAVCGGISVDMLGGGTKEECVDTAKKLIEEIGTGLVICSNKSLNYLRDGKSENILAINEFVRNYKN